MRSDPRLEYLTMPRAARELDVSTPTMRTWGRRGFYQFDVAGRQMLIRRSELERLKSAIELAAKVPAKRHRSVP